MNPYELKSEFTTIEAACALVGVYDEREAPAKVRAVRRELEITFPPIQERVPAGMDSITGERYYRKFPRSAQIPRAALLTWCEARNIRPPLLFPDPPPAPTQEPAIASRTKGTLYELLAVLFISGYTRIPDLETLKQDITDVGLKDFDPDFLEDTLKKAEEKLATLKK